VQGATPRGIAIDSTAGFLYWGEGYFPNWISRLRLPDSGSENIVDPRPGFAADIEIDSVAGKIYWADWPYDLIRRANLDGSSIETIIPESGSAGAPYFLEVDPGGGKLYWSDFDSGNIYRASLDGSGPETFISGLDRARDIEIVNGMIYWTDADARLVQRQNLDGTLREILYGPAGLVSPHGLAVDRFSGFLYVADSEGRQVYRGRVDGSIPLQPIIIPGLVNPWDVAILEVPEPHGLGWLAIAIFQSMPGRVVRRRYRRRDRRPWRSR
jgi:hypothetical protein